MDGDAVAVAHPADAADAATAVQKVSLPPAPKPRTRSFVNVPTAMTAADVWDMADSEGELANGMLPASRASKLLKQTNLPNETLKAIWTQSKGLHTPNSMMTKPEFVAAYVGALKAGGQPIQSVSEL